MCKTGDRLGTPINKVVGLIRFIYMLFFLRKAPRPRSPNGRAIEYGWDFASKWVLRCSTQIFSPSPALIMKIYSGNKRIFCIGTACWPMTRWYFIGEAWAEVLRQELLSQTCSNTQSSLSHQKVDELECHNLQGPHRFCVLLVFNLFEFCAG